MTSKNNYDYDAQEHPYVKELLAFRKLYNAALFNEWAYKGLYCVHKSRYHHDGSLCYGGDMFIAVARLPTGLISNHYYIEDWNLFCLKETEKALFPYDHHQPKDVLTRLRDFLIEDRKLPG